MNNETLIQATALKRKIDSRKLLIAHFELPIKDPINEVNQLLTGYNNMMSDFSRVEIAEFMITQYNELLKKELRESIILFDEL